MYYIKADFDGDFTDFLMHLKGKYNKKLFNLEGIGDEQTDFSSFSRSFFTTRTTTADVSVDDNSNVDNLDVISYSKELPKPIFKLNSYHVLHKKCKQLYGLSKANSIVESAITGDYYINDFYGFGGGFSYCFNYSMYDIALNGLPMVKKIKSVAPKYLYSFKSQVEQFVILAANSTLGATGLADLCIVMSLYVDKILRTGRDANFYFPGWFNSEEENAIIDEGLDADNIKSSRTEPHNKKVFEYNVWKYVEENLVSFIYTINQPGRGNQSPFTNISIYSDSFLDNMLDSYILEDHVVCKETVKKLQQTFLETMNKELKRTTITFPVTTACFAVDDHNKIPEKDKEFLNMISEQNLQFGFINIYCGKTSTLSSCCFSGSEEIEYIDGEEVKRATMKDFVSLFTNDEVDSKVDKIYKIKSVNFETNEEEICYITGILRKKNEHKYLYKITVDGKTVTVTPDHIFKVKNILGEDLLQECNAKKIYLDHEAYLIPVNTENGIDFKSIDNIEVIESDDFVYDIELEKNHYFSANGIISHNCRLRSDIENRFFNEEIVYELELEDGSTKKISSKDAIQVKNLKTNKIENLYIDEIKDKLDDYELV